MPPTRLHTLTTLALLALLAFAGNSLLCRVALTDTGIDAASFTTIRLLSGAVVLVLIVHIQQQRQRRSAQTTQQTRAGHRLLPQEGNWPSALALFAYAAGFSFAYLTLPAATGALLLFGAVQATMIGRGLWAGERLAARQTLGLVLALGGLVGLMLPGLAAPPLGGALLMVGAGVAWGVYSLRGKGAGDATRVTAGNFVRSVPMALGLSVLLLALGRGAQVDAAGLGYAVASGAITSGLGYAIWYSALPALKATQAATVQLSVPVLAAIGGVLLLAEPLSLRLVLASVAILGGVALVLLTTRPPVGSVTNNESR